MKSLGLAFIECSYQLLANKIWKPILFELISSKAIVDARSRSTTKSLGFWGFWDAEPISTVGNQNEEASLATKMMSLLYSLCEIVMN